MNGWKMMRGRYSLTGGACSSSLFVAAGKPAVPVGATEIGIVSPDYELGILRGTFTVN